MSIKLIGITLDCSDAGKLANFWSEALGRAVDADANEDFAAIGLSDSSQPAWLFIKVPEGKQAKNRCHPDLIAADRDAEVARLTTIGATYVANFEEGGHRWTTLLDPQGNEFDIVAA